MKDITDFLTTLDFWHDGVLLPLAIYFIIYSICCLWSLPASKILRRINKIIYFLILGILILKTSFGLWQLEQMSENTKVDAFAGLVILIVGVIYVIAFIVCDLFVRSSKLRIVTLAIIALLVTGIYLFDYYAKLHSLTYLSDCGNITPMTGRLEEAQRIYMLLGAYLLITLGVSYLWNKINYKLKIT